MGDAMLESIKPGQSIACTITKVPRSHGGRETLSRLMRMDPDIQKKLRKSQTRRRQNMLVYNRGNRDWTSRKKCTRIVEVAAGAVWTMTYTPHVAPDLRSIADCISVAAA